MRSSPSRRDAMALLLATALWPRAQATGRTLRVGVYHNPPKVSDLPGRAPAGIYMEVLRHVAQREGYTLQTVSGTFREGLERLQRGALDVMVDVARTPERDALFDFNREPVLFSYSQVFARPGAGIRNILDLSGKRVAVLESSVQERFLRETTREFGVDPRVVPFPTFESAFGAVRRGAADAVVANPFVASQERSGIEDTAIVLAPTSLHFATGKGRNADVLAAIDRDLVLLKADANSVYSGTFRQLMESQRAERLPPWVLPMAGAGAALLAVTLGWATSARRTTRRLREEQTRRAALMADLERANGALAAANEDLRLIGFSLSHDLRGPLAAIRGFIGAALARLQGRLDAREEELLQRSQAAAARMDAMATDLAALLRVAGEPLRRAPCDLTALAEDVVQGLREDTGRRAGVLIHDELHAHGDPRLLRLVMENLVGNAWKFSARVPSPHIEVGCREVEGARVFFVRDNGAGFDMAHADRLFHPFARLHAYDEFPGSGMGLSIVQKAVARHGGRIWVDSAPGAGTTVSFTLPEPRRGAP
ncbi:MAG: transporter substrate-binding domain-containing protein [Comamonadaceae bacterium]|nr:MAG: transporter substrate-binding domain-containing protein [Comamonadaceae bacterium]